MEKKLVILLSAIYLGTAIALAFQGADTFLEGLTVLLASLGLLALIFAALYLTARR